MNKKKILITLCLFMSIISGCHNASIPVISSPSQSNAAVAESDTSSNKYGNLKKVIIHRSPGFTEVHNEKSFYEGFDPLIQNIQNLYYIAQRGGAGINDQDREIKKQTDLKILVESTQEITNSDSNFIRLFYDPDIPEAGVNDMGHQDIIVFGDPNKGPNAYLGVQNPRKLDEWTLFKLKDYGTWFSKELDILLRAYSGQ